MNIELLAICDFSADYGGKLNVMGVFDTIFVKQLPAVHPHCSIAARLRFTKDELGAKEVGIAVTNEGGNLVLPEARVNIVVGAPEQGDFISAHVVANIGGIKFEDYGQYYVKLSVQNQQVAVVPFAVRAAKQ